MSESGLELLRPLGTAAWYGAKIMLQRLGLATFLASLACVAGGLLSVGYGLLSLCLLALWGASVAAVRMGKLMVQIAEDESGVDILPTDKSGGFQLTRG